MRMKRYKPKYLNKEKKRRGFSTSALLVYLLIAVTLTTGVSFSRYTTSVSGSDSARVAGFDVSIFGSTDRIHIDGSNSESDLTGSYTLTVTNNSEVAVEYTITVQTASPLPKGINLTMDSVTKSTDGTAAAYSFSAGTLAPGGSENHTLTVEAVLTELMDNVEQDITVSVAVAQID